MQRYDAIVIGLGGVGSSALYHLARRGQRVLGVEQFDLVHDRGSSHGQTRIIRQAYFEHSDYVPLLLRTYELWRELELTTGADLYHETGLVEVGPADGVVVPGVKAAASRFRLPVEDVDRDDFRDRFPAFRLPENNIAVFEQRAGYLRVEECVRAHIDAAIFSGAHVKSATPVRSIEVQSDQTVRVTGSAERWEAERLVMTAGAWTSPLLTDVRVPIRVVRKHQHWFPLSDVSSILPTFFYELPEGYYYGIPAGGESKVAEHSGGEPVDNPTHVSREVDIEERQRVLNVTDRWFPGLQRPSVRHAICLYSLTPDGHFIVDRHPRHPQIAIVAGLSGHGFKFTAVLGEVLADLVTKGETEHPIEFLRLGRFHPAAGAQTAQP